MMSGSLTGLHVGLVATSRSADRLAEHQLGDVDLDVLGDVGRQALDLDLAVHEVEDAALLLDALRLALDRRSAPSR